MKPAEAVVKEYWCEACRGWGKRIMDVKPTEAEVNEYWFAYCWMYCDLQIVEKYHCV